MSSPSPSRSPTSSDISDEKLEKLLSEWSKAKHQIAKLEAREKDIKSLVADIMKEEDTSTLYTENYKVTRRNQNRSCISQKDVPEDIWVKYAKKTTFPVFYLKRV